MNHKFRRWSSVGRVLLFYIGCMVILATIAPLAPLGSEPTRMLFIGALASFGAFCMTLLFVRWDGLRLGDIGAWPDRRSPLRLAFGFLIGLFLVGLHTGIVRSTGHVQWVRASGIDFPDTMITLIAFLFLSFREELAFHGYPLRRFKTLFGLWSSQLIVAIVFALEHKAGGNSWKNAFLGAALDHCFSEWLLLLREVLPCRSGFMQLGMSATGCVAVKARLAI